MIDYATLSMRGGEADGNWRKLAEAEFGQPRPYFSHLEEISASFTNNFRFPPPNFRPHM